jgi:hypothetical protein
MGRIKIICIILITFTILIGIGFYWYQRQESIKSCILQCEYRCGEKCLWIYRSFIDNSIKYFPSRDECVDWCRY